MKQINVLQLKERWLRDLLPEGFPYPSSTIISGPGGAGKPLVVLAFVASWLRAGGSVIGIPLQYPTAEFAKAAMTKIYKIALQNYRKKIAYIQFDPSISGYEGMKDSIIKANLLKPDVWNKAIGKANEMIEKGSLGTLVFGSALNLLLFSPTYKMAVIKNIEGIIKSDKSRPYLFSVSTSAFADKIKIWEEAADNLMFTRMGGSLKLFLKIAKMKLVKFSKREAGIPISPGELKAMRKIAEATRKRIIPDLMRI